MNPLLARLDVQLSRCGRRCRIEASQVALLVAGPAALGGAVSAGWLGAGAVLAGMVALLGGVLGLAAVRCVGDAGDWARWCSHVEEVGLADIVAEAVAHLTPDRSAALGRDVADLLLRRASTVPCVPQLPERRDWPHGSRLLVWFAARCEAGGVRCEAFRGALLDAARGHAVHTARVDG